MPPPKGRFMASWPITDELRAWWRRWGLTIEDLDRPSHYPWHRRLSVDQIRWVSRRHTLVANSLDRHPEITGRYRADQRGELKYFDILALAEAEDRPDA
jgi:hypothetical protein